MTIFGKSDSHKCLIWPGQLVPIVIFHLILQKVPKQLLHTEVSKWVMAAGSQSSVGCRGLFSSTHTFVAEAAQLLGRPPDYSDDCYDDCKGVMTFLQCIMWANTCGKHTALQAK